MAVGTAVKNTQGLKLILFKTTDMGGTTLSGDRYQLPLLSPPSILDLTAPLASSPQLVGKYTLDDGQSVHNRTNQMFEISFSVLCSPTVLDTLCLFMFEDGDGTNTITGNYSPPAWTNTGSTGNPTNIMIGGGGYDNVVGGGKRDMRYVGCIGKSLEITHAIDSESGKPVANVTFVTGYSPIYGDNVSDGTDTYINLTGDSATNFTDWGTDTGLTNNGSEYDLHPYSYSVSMARDIQRVGCVDYTNYQPDGCVMQGGWDISMNMVYKRDEIFASIKDAMHDSDTVVLKVADNSSSPFRIFVVGKVSEHSVDTGNPELRNSITVTGMRDVELTNSVMNLEM